jgi:hypothetical protein
MRWASTKGPIPAERTLEMPRPRLLASALIPARFCTARSPS